MEKFIEIFADALEIEASKLEAKHKFRDYEEWDSLAVLSVIAMIKQYYGIIIPRKDFDTLVTVEDLYNFVSRHEG